jgi:hypothetical protein
MDNSFTRTYEMGKDIGIRMERTRVLHELLKIAEATTDIHDKELLLRTAKTIGEKDAK